MVILWNFGIPDATPLEDVLVAMLIGFVAYKLNIYSKSHYSEEK